MATIALVIFYVFSPLLILHLCHKYRFVNKIGAVVIAYAVGFVMGNIGILPRIEGLEGTQELLTTLTIPIAIPLLLFSTDVKKWIQIAGKIIPYVLRAEPSSTPYKLPETCNECGGVLDKTTTGLACNNIICLGVVQRKIEAFLPTYITKGASKSLAKKITQSFILNLLDDDYRIDDKMEFSLDGRCVSYPKELIEFINLGFPAIVFKYIGIDALVAMGYKLDGKTIGDIHNKMINFKEELPKSPIINFIGALGIQGLGRKQVENIFEESMINSTVICRNYKSINIEQINLKKILNKKLVDNFENITNLLEIMMN